MQTLIDFVRFTKGWEYIIAIASLLLFVAFWWIASREPPDGARKEAKRDKSSR